MAQTLDGVSSTASQHGQKVLALPLQEEGNCYATTVRRPMFATPATAMPANAWVPIMGTRTSYTQRLKYSDDWSQANWTKNATTATANATTDPEGGSTATKLAEDNTNAAHNATQAMVVSSGALAAGVLVKAAERTFVRLRINNATDGNLAIAVFNLTTGTVVSGSGTIKALLNGWFWISVTGTATIADSSVFLDLSTDGATFSYVGTTGSGVYVWRATCYLAAAIGPAVQTTSATRAVTSPPVDPDDPLAFLVNEMEPDASLMELGVAKWWREYANVPADVVTYSTIAINKPTVASVGGTTAAAFIFYTNLGGGTSLGLYTSYLGYIWAPNNKVYGAVQATTSVNSGADTRITATAHGLAGTETIIVAGVNGFTGRYGIVAPAGYSVIDANTIDILGYNLGTVATSIAEYHRDYSPGPDRVRAKNTKSFYLPGVTLGIATAEDIPIPSPLINDADFLAAVIATTSGFLTYDAQALDFYKGPIYQQEVVAIDMSNV